MKPPTRALIYAQSVAVQSLDPSLNLLVYPAAQEVLEAVCDKLVTLDQRLNPTPQLATAWKVSTDNLTWTVTLRKGVVFQDGTPLNAAAVVADAQREANPLNPYKIWRTRYASVTAAGPYTVKITTKEPFAVLPYYLARVDGSMVSPTAAAKYGQSFSAHLVGSGPFQLTKLVPGTSASASRFARYWNGAPREPGIQFTYIPDSQTRLSLLQAGQADVIDNILPTDVATLKGNSNIQILHAVGARPFFIELNLNKPMFQDVTVRRALNYAIDKKGIVQTIFAGYAAAADSPASPALAGYKKVGSYGYDPAKAKQMLAGAGWTPGPGGVLQKNGQQLKFNIVNGKGQFPQGDLVVQAVQQNLNAVGCSVTITEVPAASFFSYLRVPRGKETFDSFLFGFNPSNGELGFLLQNLWQSNSTSTGTPDDWNMMWYSNPQVDSLIGKAFSTFGQSARDALYGQIQQLVWNDAPCIWLYSPDILGAASTQVRGAYVSPLVYTELRNASV
ncbi:MAG: ABC transporter substrate-binding protein [Acidimicrobiales bacterium]